MGGLSNDKVNATGKMQDTQYTIPAYFNDHLKRAYKAALNDQRSIAQQELSMAVTDLMRVNQGIPSLTIKTIFQREVQKFKLACDNKIQENYSMLNLNIEG